MATPPHVAATPSVEGRIRKADLAVKHFFENFVSSM
jgi:hypothetical protein